MSLKLTWVDNANNETGFNVERAIDNFSYSVIATVGIDVSTYTDPISVVAGKIYRYRVNAFNGIGPSAYTTAEFSLGGKISQMRGRRWR